MNLHNSNNNLIIFFITTTALLLLTSSFFGCQANGNDASVNPSDSVVDLAYWYMKVPDSFWTAHEAGDDKVLAWAENVTYTHSGGSGDGTSYGTSYARTNQYPTYLVVTESGVYSGPSIGMIDGPAVSFSWEETVCNQTNFYGYVYDDSVEGSCFGGNSIVFMDRTGSLKGTWRRFCWEFTTNDDDMDEKIHNIIIERLTEEGYMNECKETMSSTSPSSTFVVADADDWYSSRFGWEDGLFIAGIFICFLFVAYFSHRLLGEKSPLKKIILMATARRRRQSTSSTSPPSPSVSFSNNNTNATDDDAMIENNNKKKDTDLSVSTGTSDDTDVGDDKKGIDDDDDDNDQYDSCSKDLDL